MRGEGVHWWWESAEPETRRGQRSDAVGTVNNCFTEMCSGSEAGSYLRAHRLCVLLYFRLKSNKEEEGSEETERTEREGGSCAPRGGVRPFHRKSTCLTQLTLGPYVVYIWSSYVKNNEPTKPSSSTEWIVKQCRGPDSKTPPLR